jgi:hypothetical protein
VGGLARSVPHVLERREKLPQRRSGTRDQAPSTGHVETYRRNTIQHAIRSGELLLEMKPRVAAIELEQLANALETG